MPSKTHSMMLQKVNCPRLLSTTWTCYFRLSMRFTGRIPDSNKEMARVVLEMIASAPEKGRKLAVIVTTNSSFFEDEERDVIKSIKIDENDANLFEDYENDQHDYTELDFLLSEYVSRTIDVLPDDTRSACDTILMAQGLPSYLSASCLEFSERAVKTVVQSQPQVDENGRTREREHRYGKSRGSRQGDFSEEHESCRAHSRVKFVASRTCTNCNVIKTRTF